MNSTQRREARYRRRVQRRAAKRQANSDAAGTISEVFSYSNMFWAGKKCCNGVRWKQSTQNFEMHLFSGTAARRRQILDGTWKPGKYVHFTLREWGKIRPIDAPHITDRQAHKVLRQEILEPLYTPSMIYDNGASLRGKGLEFHYNRLKKQLREHYRRYGREGVVFLMDFHHFFPSAPHDLIFERHRRLILDPEIRAMADTIVGAAPGGRGMPLGVEPSQIEMVALPSFLDNFIKCQCSVKAAGHYMDDYYMIFPTREEAERVSAEVIRRAEERGFQINRKKSRIVPLDKPFRFCKVKFELTETGAVKTHGCRDGMKRARRKLRLYKRKVDAGEATTKEVWEWLQSQIAYYKKFNDHGRVLRLLRLYHAIFGGANHVQNQ